MKKVYVLLFSLLPIIIVSCGKNDNGDGIQKVEGFGQNNPEVPDAVSYDLNADSVDDFQIDYGMGVWDGIDASGLFISGYLKSLDDSTVLVRTNEDLSVQILFNRPQDTIWSAPKQPYKWNDGGSVTITEIIQAADGIWPDEWTANSEFNSNPYYLGIRVKENEDFLVGWIKLEINKTNGKIKFLEYQLTPDDYIVIDD